MLLIIIDLDHKFVPQIVAATCTLHNFVEHEKWNLIITDYMMLKCLI